MASLFDLVDGLDAPRETALGILDDALQSVYGPRSSFSASSPALLSPSSSSHGSVPPPTALITTTSVSCRAMAPSRNASDLRGRLDELVDRKFAADSADADREARDALRELGDEAQLLLARGSGCDARQAAALLTRKYVDERLDALPGSPFVLLARRKARAKIDQLRLVMPDTKTDTKSEPDTKSDTKSDTKPETKPETKTERIGSDDNK